MKKVLKESIRLCFHCFYIVLPTVSVEKPLFLRKQLSAIFVISTILVTLPKYRNQLIEKTLKTQKLLHISYPLAVDDQ